MAKTAKVKNKKRLLPLTIKRLQAKRNAINFSGFRCGSWWSTTQNDGKKSIAAACEALRLISHGWLSGIRTPAAGIRIQSPTARRRAS